MAVTRRREEVAFPSAPDPRFGGNLARATEGAQYPSGMVTGRSGNIRAPMVDQRYENYQAPHRVDYTSPRPPIQTGTPNFRPPYGAPGQPSFATWQQQIDPYPEFNPRPNLKGRFQEPAFHKFPQSGPAGAPVKGPWNREYDTPMRGGLGGLEEQAAIPNWYKWYDKLINRFGQERGSELWHQYASDDTGIGNNEYQIAMADGPNWDSMPDLADWKQGIGPGARRPLPVEPVEIELPGDDMTLGEQWSETAGAEGIGSTNEYQTAGLWQDWKRIFERTGNAELADFWIQSQRAV